MKRRWPIIVGFAVALFAQEPGAQIRNHGFEPGLEGWRNLWTREPGTGELALDETVARSGKRSARIDHRGQKDWSFEPSERLAVSGGEVFELTGWMKLAGDSDATLCVAIFGADQNAIDWSYAARSVSAPGEWRRLHSRFVVPSGIASIQPRIIGNGPGSTWVDDVTIEQKGRVKFELADLEKAVIKNSALEITLSSRQASFSVLDRRTGRRFEQKPFRSEVVLRDAAVEGGAIKLRLLNAATALEIEGLIRLDAEKPELTVELKADGELPAPLAYPHPFQTSAGEHLIVPMNEGISYPVNDPAIEPMRLIAYGGHGICMAFWGVTDGTAGHMAIIESPDDAAIRIERHEERLAIAPEWDAQRGAFGGARKLRYIFLDRGGHVRIAKRYREYAREKGLLITLADKRLANPNVDLLVGAVNVWCWDRDAVSLVKEMRQAGIGRILWSNRQSPENVRLLNELGVLTSRYDIYQDVMDPGKFPLLRWIHPDWTTKAWPGDVILDARGGWQRGWAVEGKDSEMHPCGVLCDRQALKYARERIPPELASHPYRARFIDTTTASPWNECYNPSHPMTRTESRQFKMELLRYVSEESRLVTGCETGHDASVPHLHFFEGMMSLGPYRVPDAGREMTKIWTNAPERVVKFQLGHEYRLPLWELVYHDCVVSQWYWGDYNNKLPALWDKRDLFNALYGTPPMFMFTRATWAQNRERFVQSYRNTCEIARAAGYSEMTDHRFLTSDRSVQQTEFANGLRVTVNFGRDRHLLPSGETLSSMGIHVGRSR